MHYKEKQQNGPLCTPKTTMTTTNFEVHKFTIERNKQPNFCYNNGKNNQNTLKT
jgi:hypothetical protein